ncbi:hypothetical protein ALQ33_03722 [Pseudomonas syringae pv. philadelphi]|uniref:Uncharacterized protein n=1 Tax=Pseudomonas syringae pv. philadelphi TaxID=251706 RepID=A0A3M3ZVL0_9PSED|nr:hypothetical protein ALQ33_03722 [Pseudomonas syringae pv. philadelphi]
MIAAAIYPPPSISNLDQNCIVASPLEPPNASDKWLKQS